MSVTASTVTAGVVGSPVSGSLSPILHNAWISAAGLDAVYLGFEPANFGAFVNGLRGAAIRGLNVTAPFKEEALAIADNRSERASAAGAANVLVFERSGEIRADNTDGAGLLDAISNQVPGFDPSAGPAVILGAGGAARGAVAALIESGAPSLRLINRSVSRAEALAGRFSGIVEAIVGSDAERSALNDANVLINATPRDPQIDLAQMPRSAVVMDMVYRPLRTPFLARAEAMGFPVVDGLAMLIAQARPSFEAFFDRPPPDIDVRAMAVQALEGRP